MKLTKRALLPFSVTSSLALTLPIALTLALAGETANASAPLPQLPGGSPAAAPTSASGASSPATATGKIPAVSLETAATAAAERGVVQVLRGGRIVSLGTVLGRDGRVLTALSSLGGSESAEVRYADGTTAPAKLGHLDPEWDLALLVPQSGPHWSEGLAASSEDPGATDLRAFAASLPSVARIAAAHAANPTAAAAAKAAIAMATATAAPFQGRSDVHAKDGTVVHDALELQAKSALVGSPVIDANGAVIALLVRACKDTTSAEATAGLLDFANPHPASGDPAKAAKAAPHPACTPVTVGAPVSALRNFLIRTPSTAVAPSPWLGIVGEIEHAGAVNGVRVLAVAPQSPADKSGLRASSDVAKADVVTAVDGVPVDSPERLSEEIAKHSIGQKLPLLVFKDGKLREVPVTLRAAP
jgi:S1-C subfamily serine protease